MVARAYTVAFEGVEARMVEVQCAVAAGLPYFGIVGLPGCTLWTSAEETFVLPAPNNTGSVLWAVAIPNDPLLLGTSSFFQGLCFELPGYPRWASMSNAVGVRIGNQ